MTDRRIQPEMQVLRRRRTRIVATLGPASCESEQITALLAAGVDVFRLNMSHGDHETHARSLERVRAAAERAGQHVAVLADLCGPKIRVGQFDGGSIQITAGSEVTVTTRDVPGAPGLIPSRYRALASDVVAGNRILLDDGNLELSVLAVEGTEIRCRVVHGGVLKDRKGMNLPGVAVSAPALTEKDRADAHFALEAGVDLLALSFVRAEADVLDLKELIRAAGYDTPVIAKIEKPEALEAIDGILRSSDGIMVARGDLGVELPPEQVPVAQSELTALAREHRVPVIVATQMLESMVENSSPTRAEVTDVSHAVLSGADAVMLSAETAAGANPVAAVTMMDRIARQAEGHLWKRGNFGSLSQAPSWSRAPTDEGAIPLGLAVARSTAQLSRDLMVRAIVVASQTGTSARQVSSSRPAAPILGLSDRIESCRRMSLLWGVVPVHVGEEDFSPESSPHVARRLAAELGLASPGDRILQVRGFHEDPALEAPTITVLSV